jgi:pyruvate dehydrogenase E1 component alpha subunit
MPDKRPERQAATTRSKDNRKKGKPESHALRVTASMGTLDDGKLKRLYSEVLHCRMLSERARRLRGRSVSAGPDDYSPGREAIFAGSLTHLAEGDCVVSSHRDLICHYAGKTPLKTIFRRLRAKKPGDGVEEFSRMIIAPTLLPESSAPIGMGTGMALSFKTRKLPFVTMAFSSDEMYGQSPWHEAVRFSALHKLPIVHVIHFPSRTKAKARPDPKDLEAAALSYGMPPIIVDAGDAVAIYRVTFEAIRRAREGHGPALIVCIRTRLDGLEFMEDYLRKKKLWSDDWRNGLEKKFRAEMDKAVKRTPA